MKAHIEKYEIWNESFPEMLDIPPELYSERVNKVADRDYAIERIEMEKNEEK